MAVITSQQITKYYDSYKNIEISFTKQVSVSTGLLPNEVFFRVLGMHSNSKYDWVPQK